MLFKMNEREIKKLLSEMTPPMVNVFNDGMQKIHRYERRKKRMVWMISSACMAVILGLSLHFVNTREIRDSVITSYSPVIESNNPIAPTETSSCITTVWVIIHPDDIYYHKANDCPMTIEESVSLPLETAVELRKEPCDICYPQNIDH